MYADYSSILCILFAWTPQKKRLFYDCPEHALNGLLVIMNFLRALYLQLISIYLEVYYTYTSKILCKKKGMYQFFYKYES